MSEGACGLRSSIEIFTRREPSREETVAGIPGGPLISIVDDDESLRGSLENLIRSFGFRAQAFPSAEAFLGWKQANETACLILDVRMPGMNGLDLQSQMARGNWLVPIIFITSHADDDAHARALEAGAVAFLYKPCREEDLIDAMNAALGRPRDLDEP
jgi:FixJ family two-component response regulator